jgi:hypothetical protein
MEAEHLFVACSTKSIQRAPLLGDSNRNPAGASLWQQVTKNVEEQGIDPCASRMLSERSTI